MSNPTMPIQSGALADPARPPMDPASGFRRVKLRPHEMKDAVTASDDVFVLAHLGIPRIDPAQWSLSIDGLAGRACTLNLDELKARPKRIVEAVHQCCGSPLEPTVPTRRVVNVRWGGVDLATLLDELEVDPRARSSGRSVSTAASLPGVRAIGTSRICRSRDWPAATSFSPTR